MLVMVKLNTNNDDLKAQYEKKVFGIIACPELFLLWIISSESGKRLFCYQSIKAFISSKFVFNNYNILENLNVLICFLFTDLPSKSTKTFLTQTLITVWLSTRHQPLLEPVQHGVAGTPLLCLFAFVRVLIKQF